jgi:Photosynthetic reaction centre cytochrome C subunit
MATDQRRRAATHSSRACWLVTLSCVLIAGVGTAARQGPFPPTSLRNLQVLSKDSSPQEVIAAMRGMSQGLGVRCQYCHVGREGQPLDQFNFVSDDVDKKGVARSMLQLVRTINATLAPGAPSGPVTCYTCHRGAARPVHTPPPA